MTNISKCPLALILTSCIGLRSCVGGGGGGGVDGNKKTNEKEKKRRVKTFQRPLFQMKYVALAPYVRLCAIAGLGPWF